MLAGGVGGRGEREQTRVCWQHDEQDHSEAPENHLLFREHREPVLVHRVGAVRVERDYDLLIRIPDHNSE